MKNQWLLLTAVGAGLLCGLGAGFLLAPLIFGSSANQAPVVASRDEVRVEDQNKIQVSAQPVKVDYANLLGNSVSPDLLESAVQAGYDWQVVPGTRVILVPHHLVAAREIASLISATPKPKRVYLVVPDHFGACREKVCSPLDLTIDGREPWPQNQTDYQNELALSALAPFIYRVWGEEVEIVPIMIWPGAGEDVTQSLSDLLSVRLKLEPESLLIGSIDASHYLPAETADFHDVLTVDVVRALADKEADNTEIDAPSVLRTVLRVARDLELGRVTVHAQTNSLRLMQAKFSQDSTSHILASFSPGAIENQQKTTLLLVGDMMFDRNVAGRSARAGSLEYPLARIRGAEDRFFKGQDLLIGNLEGPVTTKRGAPDKGEVDFMFDPKILEILEQVGFDALSQANNHTYDQGKAEAQSSRLAIAEAGISVFGDQVLDDAEYAMTVVERRGRKIALLAFNTTDNPLDKQAAEQAVKSALEQVDHTVVYMHWGNEYQAKPHVSQVDLAHWLIDLGVDAVIGSHPHWMQSVEVYKERPIAYSLGNFIFDQDWSKETNLGLVVGLVLAGEAWEMHLFPIQIDKSQPRLLTGDDRRLRLEYLASISQENLSFQIKNGVIKSIE